MFPHPTYGEGSLDFKVKEKSDKVKSSVILGFLRI